MGGRAMRYLKQGVVVHRQFNKLVWRIWAGTYEANAYHMAGEEAKQELKTKKMMVRMLITSHKAEQQRVIGVAKIMEWVF